ncbi:glycosyltransferase family 1 protein [Leptospira bourretii]|uniref:glycosyltransferase family 4 protein n=1 Tax=Leptospira bourretii TaxID=2484962 RepID=UPI0010914E74|nr:glycosyltransferase family 1 protein [Leptospira bourretii]TGL19589.1 glycosyltransferase family 1 protein [Leptospira bourretii]
MIVFDFQIFLNQKYGGISLLFAEVMERLHNQKEEFEVPIISTKNENLKNRAYFKPYSFFSFPKDVPEIEDWLWGKSFSGKTIIYPIYKSIKLFYNKIAFRFIYGRNRTLIARRLKNSKVQIFHPTYFDTYFFDLLKDDRRIKKVITIYDLTHERFPGFYKLSDVALKNRKKLCDFSDKIISISESTKKDLLEFYQIPEKKIEVIHLGSNIIKVPDKDLNFIWKDYILFVGDRGGYKNFNNFIEGIAPIIYKYKVNLVLLGGKKLSGVEKESLQKLNLLGKTIHINFTSDSELKYYYQNASLFVFPSLYEGFGIPLVDAMSLGCPVICSNTSSFPEVVGDAAIQFDPWFPDSITNAAEQIFRSSAIRKKMIQKGLIRSEQFTWERCADKHIDFYNRILSKETL